MPLVGDRILASTAGDQTSTIIAGQPGCISGTSYARELTVGREVVQLALETTEVFALMATAYRTGLLEKTLPLIGLAIDGCKEDVGINYGDLLEKIDETKKETIEKMDRFFGRFGFLLRLANNERLLGFCSRLLDSQAVKRVTVFLLERFLVKAVGGRGGLPAENPIPLGKRS
jgi:hypothetical protein